MLIRFIVKNLFSFKEQTEFNLLPGRATRLSHHKYERNGVAVLKQSAIYGANGSGKSNLIKSIAYLQATIIGGVISNSVNSQKFKLSKASQSEPIELGIEFYCKPHTYYYSIAINNDEVIDEYFAETGLDKEKMIFHRATEGSITSISFFDEFSTKPENILLGNVIEKDLIKPDVLLFSFLNQLSNDAFVDMKNAFKWFDEYLTIITPMSKAAKTEHLVDTDAKFRNFTNEMMCSFNTGISDIEVEVLPVEDVLRKENQNEINQITAALRNENASVLPWENRLTGENFLFVKKEGKIVLKRLLFHHKGEKNDNISFYPVEESDGTQRLLELVPAFFSLINFEHTFIIDEIERSLHPSIIKELISKFSHDEHTQGQLIFSTHESNLLDQEIFRPDEIWFAEKGANGATKLYSLNDFREHSTIDIRKGYLSGRYGGIPFLGNLHDLNWDKE